jgi:hypothetical protein
MTVPAPRSHHLDKRAADIGDVAGSDDDLLDPRQLAAWLGVSTHFLKIGRHRGYGPRYYRASPHQIRYRRGDVRQWLNERSHQSTAEYARRPSGGGDEAA